jgi:hypothetical protein
MTIPPPPQPDQIWEVIDSCEAHVQFLFSAPITFSGTAKLIAGERVRVTAFDRSAAVVSFLPVRYAELHDEVVPADIRGTPRYKSFILTATADFFTAHFRQIDGAA